MEITIATSIVPRNIELQRDAISSWKNLGFNVISVNSREEIKLIKDLFVDVKFEEVSRNALALAGKPFVYFDDILKSLESTGPEICGIVNSDIYLFADEQQIDFILREAQEAFLFGSRIDISSIGSLAGEEYFLGFDYFFFSRNIIKEYIVSTVCLGVPWWDYWAPLVPIIKGFPVKQLVTPFAYHIKHPTRWRDMHFIAYAKQFLNCLRKEDLRRNMKDDLIELLDDNNKSLDISLLAFRLLEYINRNTKRLYYHSPSDARDTENIDYMQLLAIIDELAYCKKHQKNMEKLFIDQVTSFHNSYSWKITAPLRWISEKLSVIVKDR